MMRLVVIVGLVWVMPQASQAYCDPPIAPGLTTEIMAREFREEFKAEFETYFSDAQSYISCIDVERQQILHELKETAVRYERFLADSKGWDE